MCHHVHYWRGEKGVFWGVLEGKNRVFCLKIWEKTDRTAVSALFGVPLCPKM